MRTLRPLWYSRNFTMISSTLSKIPSQLRVHLLPVMECPLYGFAADGHSIPDKIVRVGLVQQVFNYAIQHYQPVLNDPGSADVASHLHDRVQALDNQMISVRATLDVTVARQMEDRCEKINDKRLGRIVIHGLPRISGVPRDQVKVQARANVSQKLSNVFSGIDIPIAFVDYFDSKNPVYEVTLSDPSVASTMRQEFGRRSLQDRKATGISVMNCVTPATRVRISILKVCNAYHLLQCESCLVFMLCFYLYLAFNVFRQ